MLLILLQCFMLLVFTLDLQQNYLEQQADQKEEVTEQFISVQGIIILVNYTVINPRRACMNNI